MLYTDDDELSVCQYTRNGKRIISVTLYCPHLRQIAGETGEEKHKSKQVVMRAECKLQCELNWLMLPHHYREKYIF